MALLSPVTLLNTQADKMSPISLSLIVRVLFPDWSGTLTAALSLVSSLLQIEIKDDETQDKGNHDCMAYNHMKIGLL